ncbi:hemicentin-2 isoform X2 [Exaiptasia diaphana]|uniref:Ig-like domain-containing protein n=1 Tax=Exaiptasia diaphana TaxID=2652724 RepID=A0A913YQB5_EXADI|nr:hemicentin-2 isoform X2 [Exaiptasia diaphana]
MMYSGLCASSYTCVILMMLFRDSDAAARFTKHPADTLYVVKGQTARFTWDYHVDNINTEFDARSPRWYFHNNTSWLVGYGDAFDGRKFKIDTNTCPARLRIPTVRVSVEGKATLVITDVTMADSGTYGCRLFLSSGPLSSMPTSKSQLIVTETPRFTSKPSPKVIFIESSFFSLTCAAVGTPTPNVTWIQVITGVTISKGQGTAVLLLPNINRSQSGEYECQAVNNPNEAPVIAKTMITVYYKPIVDKVLSTTNISSWADNTIDLRCYWSSSLPIPSWTWYKPNGDTITTNVRSISNGSEVTVLTGNNNHDYGMYRCEATNIAGSDHHNISVTRLFPPGRIQLIEVASIRSSSVTIIWARPADNGGSPVTTYKVLIDSNSIKVFNTTIQEPKRESCTASSQHSSVSDTKIGILAAFLALSLITIAILLAFIVWKHRMTNSQNTKQEQKNEQVYENADAIGMGPLTSPSRHPLQSKEKPKPDKTPAKIKNIINSSTQQHFKNLRAHHQRMNLYEKAYPRTKHR